MESLPRLLDIDLPKGRSAFLWGPRKTGKTTYLRERFPDSLRFDLLQTDRLLELTGRPSLLREQILAAGEDVRRRPIVIDEVQKVPALLDEVHWLIENHRLRFILSGSSARKLTRGQANRLGGRAWRYQLFPLAYPELTSPSLLEILNRGLIPSHYLEDGYRRSLRAYAQDYLKEEVFAEGLTRNVPAFSRFFEAMGFSHGELTNYANIARECGVDPKTVKEYYQILVDTLLGSFVPPFKRRQDRNVILKAPKFYLFDVGVAGSLVDRRLTSARGEAFGRALEHFVFMELQAHASYRELHYPVEFWRTKAGQEVDFVLARGEVAVEVKGSSRVDPRDLRSLEAFAAEYRPRQAIVVCNEARERVHGNVRVMPWARFLEALWEGKILA